MASEMDPEETEYLAHLACPTIADDSLAHQGGSDVGQGGRNCCDGLRRTPGIVRGVVFVRPARGDDSTRPPEPWPASYFRLPSTSGTGSTVDIGVSSSLLVVVLLLLYNSFYASNSISDCSRPTNHRHSHLRKNTTTITITNRHGFTQTDGPECCWGCVPKSRPGREKTTTSSLINTFTDNRWRVRGHQTHFPLFFFLFFFLVCVAFVVFTVLLWVLLLACLAFASGSMLAA